MAKVKELTNWSQFPSLSTDLFMLRLGEGTGDSRQLLLHLALQPRGPARLSQAPACLSSGFPGRMHPALEILGQSPPQHPEASVAIFGSVWLFYIYICPLAFEPVYLSCSGQCILLLNQQVSGGNCVFSSSTKLSSCFFSQSKG